MKNKLNYIFVITKCYKTGRNSMKLLLLMTLSNKISERVTGETNWIVINLISSVVVALLTQQIVWLLMLPYTFFQIFVYMFNANVYK